MSIGRMFALVCCLLCGPVSLPGQAGQAVPEAAVRVEQVSLAGVRPDRLTFTAKLGIFPETSINVRSFSFSAMKVNGLPVYVSPLNGRFALKKGQYLKLPDVQMVIYERDLVSVEPLRSAVDQQKVVLAGLVTATIDASLIGELALRSLHPRIVLPFSKEIPVLIPGGEMGQKAALATLDVVAHVTPAAAKLLGRVFAGEDAAWRTDVSTNEVRHLLVVHTAYTVVERGSSTPLEFEQLGFWIGPSTALVSEEAIAPWEFDPEVQARLAARHAHVDKDSIVISVQPLAVAGTAALASDGSSAAEGWVLSQGDFKIEVVGKSAESREAYSPSITPLKVRQRASANNCAVLRFRDGIVGDPVRFAGAAENRWDRLAMVRLVRNAADNSLGNEVILLPGTTNGGAIQFAQPVDESAFGSPVFTQDGAIAMVQDGNSATFLASIKHLEQRAK